eukprot:m.93031 g.93031  ORF g.93031 m.93031 type:complete len:591 (+) comp13377_c0_seq6:77-1849(+)
MYIKQNYIHFLLLLLFCGVGESLEVPPIWCNNNQAPAQPGMYGNLDVKNIGFSGPRGALGQYVDLPDNNTIVILFQQGLAQLYGFNNVEALRNFKTAAELDPHCALCFWGVAMSYAPNINYDIENQQTLNNAALTAKNLLSVGNLQNKTIALIMAIQELVGDAPSMESRSAWANHTCTTIQGDADVDTFCSAATMSLTPWNYYQGLSAGGEYPLKEMLTSVKTKLETWANKGHVFAIHLLIHLLEPSNAPKSYRWQALSPTLMLFNSSHGQELVPSQGHLTHMPAHLFLRVGMYNEGVTTSTVSTTDNREYIAKCLTPYGYGHNLKMMMAHERLCGMSIRAVETGIESEKESAGQEKTPDGQTTCVDCAGPGNPYVVLALARFAQWDEIIEYPLPNTWGGYDVFTRFNEAANYLARAHAYFAIATSGASLNRTALSLADKFTDLSIAAIMSNSTYPNLNYTVMIPSELKAARAWRVDKDHAKAIKHLEELVNADDYNPYMEPPLWYYPPRQCLGFALMHAPPPVRDITRALSVFQQDLSEFVENAWSLYGAAEAYANLGMKENASEYKRRGDIAWRNADHKFQSSCPILS